MVFRNTFMRCYFDLLDLTFVDSFEEYILAFIRVCNRTPPKSCITIEFFLHNVRRQACRMSGCFICLTQICKFCLKICIGVENPHVVLSIISNQTRIGRTHCRIQTRKLARNFFESDTSIDWSLEKTAVGGKNYSSRIIKFIWINSPKGASFAFTHQNFFFGSVGSLLRKTGRINQFVPRQGSVIFFIIFQIWQRRGKQSGFRSGFHGT